jgi:hypothetical protein
MCKFIRFLYIAVPIRGFRAYLIQWHISGCSACQKQWTIDWSTQESFAKAKWIQNEQSLWPRIQEKISGVKIEDLEPKGKKAPLLFPRWKWALAGLAAFICLAATLLILSTAIPKRAKTGISSAVKTPRIHINYAKIDGNKAKPFVFQTPENLFIWFEKIQREGD